MKTYKSPMFEFLEFKFRDVVMSSSDGLIDDVFGTQNDGENTIW